MQRAGFELLTAGEWSLYDIVLADLGDDTIERLRLCFGPPWATQAERENGATMTWDLWIDHQARSADGLTPTLARFAHTGVTLEVGAVVIVGADDAEPAVAEIR